MERAYPLPYPSPTDPLPAEGPKVSFPDAENVHFWEALGYETFRCFPLFSAPGYETFGWAREGASGRKVSTPGGVPEKDSGPKVSYPRAAGRSDGRKSRTLAPPAAPDGQKSRTLAPPAAPDGQKSGTLAPLAAPDGEKFLISLAAGCRPPGRIDRLRALIPAEV